MLLQVLYHVCLVQSLLPVVQFFLQETLLLAEQLLQQEVVTANAVVSDIHQTHTIYSIYNTVFCSQTI